MKGYLYIEIGWHLPEPTWHWVPVLSEAELIEMRRQWQELYSGPRG
jgi:hypothetical protein